MQHSVLHNIVGALIVTLTILLILLGIVVFVSQPADRPIYTMVPIVYDRME